MDLVSRIPDGWRTVLHDALAHPSFDLLQKFLVKEVAEHQVFPPPEDLFTALRLTPFSDVKVLILGQDPYHDDGQAHGLAFSVRRGVKPPPSLANIYKELASD